VTEQTGLEKITLDDLKRLTHLALSNFEDFFSRNPGHDYVGRLRLICLLQTAAKHYVEPDLCTSPDQTWGGVNDFDVCGFFETVSGRHLYAQRKVNLDFGPSKFGRNPDDGEQYKGRRVDVMWRDIVINLGQTSVEAVQGYLRNARPGTSAHDHWAAKPAVVLWPKEQLGHVIQVGCKATLSDGSSTGS
jgi:hypothetical protein